MIWEIWRIEADGVRSQEQASRWGDMLAMAMYPARIEVTEAD